MTTTKMILIAAGGAAMTFALALFAIHIQLASELPSGFGLIPFFLLLPAEVLGELLASRAAFLIVGFLEFFFVYMLALLSWRCIRGRKGAKYPYSTEGVRVAPVCNSDAAGRVGPIAFLSQRSTCKLWRKQEDSKSEQKGSPPPPVGCGPGPV